MIDVFDVSGSLLSHARNESMSPLKLQKLAFYSFGWYAHLTGEKLFHDRFYAMQYGPVVSPLLTAHSSTNSVSKAELESYQGCSLDIADDYAAAVVDAVWAAYGEFNHSQLIEMTHCETPWDLAWNKRRPAGARRSDLSSDEIVDYFQAKTEASYAFSGRVFDVPVLALLPSRRETSVSEIWLHAMDTSESAIPVEHAQRAAELRRKFLISA
ncbi:type II toxin-antitoxin system antitoxin SocA domain-containing protein [Arthrobacter sp. EpRS71]|uniref:Panacea domain-containing protein n=1 Tax=Arthrobacter sp. EpRS71 TaxID=1743141 RepID=UPI000746CA67|nr:type II toxin-antitoxin system antitoxin SocA domain-containing protein [Arthrobacter sp. EpRS71]KUM34587.1 hypothetical protein AR689_10625 [Arthrobacter sp. EpRS71]